MRTAEAETTLTGKWEDKTALSKTSNVIMMLC